MQFTLFQLFKTNIHCGAVNLNKRSLMFVKNLEFHLWHTVHWKRVPDGSDSKPCGFRSKRLASYASSLSGNAIHENIKFVEVIDQIARSKGVSKAQIALAWVLSQDDNIISIPGTRKVHRLEENLGAFNVELTTADRDLIQASIPTVTIGIGINTTH
jgi:aryl-alcohol dehydrogenase-like predicted oxidoreductase